MVVDEKDTRFIESDKFPIDEVNEASAKEKSTGGTPPHWNMVFWWTRKPLAGARAVVAGALVSEKELDTRAFLRWLYPSYNGKGFDKVPHYDNPDFSKLPVSVREVIRQRLKNTRLLDPFAGFGSIPLEAVRLGVGEVVAVELLPTAYVFLKAVLEYPKELGGIKKRVRLDEIKKLGLGKILGKYSLIRRVFNGNECEVPSLIYDVDRWGKWVTEKLKEDPDIKEIYDNDIVVYIGTWEVKCPICDRYTPLVGNWWLARVGQKKGNVKIYKRLTWMQPKIVDDRVDIEVVDLNKIYGDVSRAKITTKSRRFGKSELKSYTVEINGKKYRVQEPNIAGGADYAVCLLCGNTMIDEEVVSRFRERVESEARKKITILPIRFTDAFYRHVLIKGIDKTFKELRGRAKKGVVDQDLKAYRLLEASRKITAFKKLLKEVLNSFTEEELMFYPKRALRDWNQRLEQYLEGKIGLDELRDALARPRLLVKVRVVNKDLKFEPCTEEDNEKLWRALEKLKQTWRDPDIPTEPIPEYETRRITPILGAKYWYQFFNPRQLLTLVKLVKLIREVGKRVEEEKLREGWSKKDAFKYAEAVTTYLAIALCRHIYDNAVIVSWNPATGYGSSSALLRSSHALAYRGIAVVWNWAEYPITSTAVGYVRDLKHIVDGLSYLVSAVGGSSSRVRVVLNDATKLYKLKEEKFDVVVTDPPYRDDVPYTELSDFYYVWLKRALSNIEENQGKMVLTPRFYVEAFFERKNGELKEISTQWQKRDWVLREISYNEGRVKALGSGTNGLNYYRSLMAEAFITMDAFLKDTDVLVTYFAHTKPEAWAELVEASWKYGGFTATNGFPLTTESAQSVIKRGKLSLDTSIVVVWKKPKSNRPSVYMDTVKEEMLREGTEWTRRVLGKYRGRDLFFSVFTRVLSVATRYDTLYDDRGEVDTKRLVEEYVAPLTAEAIINAVSEEEAGRVRLDKAGLFYFIIKLLYAVSRAESTVKILSSTDIVLLSIAVGVDKKEFIDSKIIVKSGGKEEYRFMEPLFNEPSKFEEFLRARGMDPDRFEVMRREPCSVDILHLMEYATLFTSDPKYYIERLKKRHPGLFENALSLARLLHKHLPHDLESQICTKLINYIGGWMPFV